MTAIAPELDPTEAVAVARSSGWPACGPWTQFKVLTARSMRDYLSDRRLLALQMLQSLLLLLMFSQVLGNVANPDHFPSGVSYIDYLMPAILVTTGIGSATGSGSQLIRDMENGMLTRFRTLPIDMHWILFARAATDLLRLMLQMVVTLVCAAACLGFRPHGGPVGVAAAMLLAILVIWSLTWIFMALAAWLRSARIMQSISAVGLLPLMIASSAYIPLDSMPTWLHAAAVVNPLTYAVDASRALALGTPALAGVLASVLTSGLVAAIAMFAAVRGFRRPSVQ
ncbi:ABC transporter permease [Streptomyces europaeiscabiei]|uniref:ABC transporter permease n=1 Tax=Streptomyces europaeiscabiei TaxID=146819 RepID=UPI002E16DC33